MLPALLSVTVTVQCYCHCKVLLSLYSVTGTVKCYCHCTVLLSLYRVTGTVKCYCHYIDFHATDNCSTLKTLEPRLLVHLAPNLTVLSAEICHVWKELGTARVYEHVENLPWRLCECWYCTSMYCLQYVAALEYWSCVVTLPVPLAIYCDTRVKATCLAAPA